ncbi:hypothetical protein BDN72DRAFT_898959 [Pluteus cervinus]|uniref:Uncharacterized protein n=1 Tax=Pluteus cervinus TaxID=181527 RepID=A0ACD3AP01_9AGAR|nr:hypothetical protein BDN72DRAFT_898959 [Pluteus cervinus]
MATSHAFKPLNHSSFDNPAVASLADAVKGGLVAIEVLLVVRGSTAPSLDEEPLPEHNLYPHTFSELISSRHETSAPSVVSRNPPRQENAAPLRVLENPIPTSNPSNNASPTFRFGHAIHSAAAFAIMHFPSFNPLQQTVSTVACARRSLPFPNLCCEAIGLPPVAANHQHCYDPPSSRIPGPTFIKIDPETHNIISTAGRDDVKVIVRSPGPQPTIAVNEATIRTPSNFQPTTMPPQLLPHPPLLEP